MRKIVFMILPVLSFFGCEEQNTIIRDTDKVNSWIHAIMREHYLWSAAMPAMEATDLTLHPETYFNNAIRYRDGSASLYGDRFSYIRYTGNLADYPVVNNARERAAIKMEYNLGFDIRLASVAGEQGQEVYCQVLYVVPNSPAWDKGIRRGDCFDRISGTAVTSITEYNALIGTGVVELDFFYPQRRSVTVSKGSYVDTPLIFDTIYDLQPRTGYLVYNHFTAGENGRFFNELRSVFRTFRSKGVRNIILDLRYNGGGEIAAARQLSSLLVPADNIGELFFYKERNASYGRPDRFESEPFLDFREVGDCNPDIDNLYVITSAHTASASELLIHCLKPFFRGGGSMTVVGNKTYGKNVGGITVTNKRYEWEIHPITLRVYDKYKVSGFENGISPDLYATELYPVIQTEVGPRCAPIGGFGNVAQEVLLRETMGLIYGRDDWGVPWPEPGGPAYEGDGTRATGITEQTTVPERGLTERDLFVD